MRGSLMSSSFAIELALNPSPTDYRIFGEERPESMVGVLTAFEQDGISILESSCSEDDVPEPGVCYSSNIGPLANEVVAFATALGPASIAALGGWLAGRNGRKVKIKVGEIEAEANSVKQLDEVLKRVGAMKYYNEPKRIHE